MEDGEAGGVAPERGASPPCAIDRQGCHVVGPRTCPAPAYLHVDPITAFTHCVRRGPLDNYIDNLLCSLSRPPHEKQNASVFDGVCRKSTDTDSILILNNASVK